MPIESDQACPVTSPSSWTATAAGRRSTACRASRATGRAPRRCARWCAAAREIGLRALTLYAFSAQNWQRPPDEVATLMQLLRDYVIEERDEIMDNDIRLIAIGDVDRLPGVRQGSARRADARFGRQPVDDAVPGAVLRRARVDRRGGARAVRGGRERRARARRRSPRSGSRRRCRPAGCRSWTCWCGRRARSGCRTSCSGRRPTPSSTSPTRSGRRSASRSSTRRWSRTGGRERRFGRTREQIRSAG